MRDLPLPPWIELTDETETNCARLLSIWASRLMPMAQCLVSWGDLISLETSSARGREIPASLIRPNRGIKVGFKNSRTLLPLVARDDFESGVMRGREFPIGEFVKELPDGLYIALAICLAILPFSTMDFGFPISL